MRTASFHPEAEAEMFAAARYYEDRAENLGVDFLAEVEKAVHRIAEAPETWPIFKGRIRRYLLYRFPFGILFTVHADSVVIIAVMHLRRRPNYWKDRL